MAAEHSQNIAKVLAKQILRTNASHRPYPSLMSFPGLSSKPYHNPDHFSFTKDFENNVGKIKEEYKSLKIAYGAKEDYEKQKGEHTLNSGEWHWMNYVSKGHKIEELFKKHCPVTTSILEGALGNDRLMTGTPFSYTFFSTMQPKTSIKPHYGATNLKLRCHFPLFVPDEAFLRVAGDPRPWVEGKMIVFDDSYEHEAANLSDTEERVILLIDIWHPDLHRDEILEI